MVPFMVTTSSLLYDGIVFTDSSVRPAVSANVTFFLIARVGVEFPLGSDIWFLDIEWSLDFGVLQSKIRNIKTGD